MEYILDTANITAIKHCNEFYPLAGVTTNPSLIAKEGKVFEEVIKEITTIVDGPISAEVVAPDAEGMVVEARKLASIHKNIVIKIPVTLEGLKAVYIGDGNNMANSIIVGCLKSGMDVAVGCPDAYRPDQQVIDFAATVEGHTLTITSDIFEAAKDADVIFTDVWASMGQEGEKEQRMRDFEGYCVDEKLMAVAKPGCMVMHCLPAHRGEEISEGVFESHADEIFEEAENRLHAQKAVMVLLMKDN